MDKYTKAAPRGCFFYANFRTACTAPAVISCIRSPPFMIDGGNRLSWMVLAGLYFIIFLKEGEPE